MSKDELQEQERRLEWQSVGRLCCWLSAGCQQELSTASRAGRDPCGAPWSAPLSFSPLATRNSTQTKQICSAQEISSKAWLGEVRTASEDDLLKKKTRLERVLGSNNPGEMISRSPQISAKTSAICCFDTRCLLKRSQATSHLTRSRAHPRQLSVRLEGNQFRIALLPLRRTIRIESGHGS